MTIITLVAVFAVIVIAALSVCLAVDIAIDLTSRPHVSYEAFSITELLQLPD